MVVGDFGGLARSGQTGVKGPRRRLLVRSVAQWLEMLACGCLSKTRAVGNVNCLARLAS